MPKAKSHEEKVAYINANRSYIPARQIKYFNGLDVDKQYKKMVTYVRNSGKSTLTRFNVKSVIKSILDKNPTPAQVKKVIEELENWANNTTKREIDEIDKQIAELNKKREALIK